MEPLFHHLISDKQEQVDEVRTYHPIYLLTNSHPKRWALQNWKFVLTDGWACLHNSTCHCPLSEIRRMVKLCVCVCVFLPP